MLVFIVSLMSVEHSSTTSQTSSTSLVLYGLVNPFSLIPQSHILFLISLICLFLLKEIDNSHPEYSEAKKLLSMLEYFNSVPEEYVPTNSLLREFIGGSIFYEK